MAEVGVDRIDLDTLWDVLSVPPVFNFHTLHTELMCPAWSQFVTALRNHIL